MKKISLVIMTAITVAFLQACSGHTKASTADSANTKTDSTANKGDSSKTATNADSSSTMLSDTAFASKAAVGGMAEVALGKMAAARGSSGKIKDFGNMMVKDHGKANAELKSIAQTKNITLPAGLDAEHQAKSDSLSKLSSADFDKAYVQAMVEGHKKTLALMQAEAANGKDAQLKAFAAKTAPVVQMHLKTIQNIQAGMK